jgi:TusE/DsrC/DsvC family sulfur relay protein
MADSMNDIMHPGGGKQPGFPDAPQGWTPADAERIAKAENLALSEDHWEVIKALQRIFARDAEPGIRRIHDAFDEHFHGQGGMRYLYRILPAGPVAQGCRLAGLKAPAGSTDASFGSVQ